MVLENESYRNILENLYDGLYFTDRNRVISYWNRAAERITGFTAGEVVGRPCSDNILTHIDADGNQLCPGLCPLAATMADGKPREAEVYLHHKKGHRVPVSIKVSTLTDKDGKVIGGIELFTDIRDKEVNTLRLKELERLAMLDELTGLANRRYIEKEIKSRIDEHKRFDLPFGIFFIDIDHFKKVNDMYGHEAGDAVLTLAADTFVANTRPFDIYGRWGGEEFIGVLRNLNEKDLETLGNRIRTLVENAYTFFNDRKLSVTVSMGATMMRDSDTLESLIRRADALMYTSKNSGRNCLTLG